MIVALRIMTVALRIMTVALRIMTVIAFVTGIKNAVMFSFYQKENTHGV